jgi:hypothetical protein
MARLIETIEWENDHTRLVALTGLPRGPGKYQTIKGRKIRGIYGHHSAGNRKAGQAAALAIASFHTAKPVYSGSKWTGGGRGWPGAGYQIVVPTTPEEQDGRLVVYRTASDDTWTYHTGPGHNAHGIGIVVAGCYQSRHRSNDADDDVGPGPSAAAAFEDVAQYLLAKHSLTAEEGLFGHFDAGKATCPGDWLEQLIRHLRGETFPHPRDRLVLGGERQAASAGMSVKDRQQALLGLGFYLGPTGADGAWGPLSKEALRAFQRSTGVLVVDGVWGPRTEAAMKLAMAEASR